MPRSLHCVAILVAALAIDARQSAAQRVSMPVGIRLTYIGERKTIDAKVLDNAGRPIAGASLTYHIVDATVAAVSPRGEVTARKPGTTRIWAASGKDSNWTIVQVQPYASHFAFTPASIRLEAINARQPLKVATSDAAGVPIAGAATKTSACRSLNERVAVLTASDVVARGNGSTFIRCADRGLADSVRVDVRQRAVSASITNKIALRSKAYGDTFTVRISVKDAQGQEVTDARPTFSSLNPERVSIEPLTGKAHAVNNGDAKILVQVGDIPDSTVISVSGSPVFAVPAGAVLPADSTPAASSKAAISTADVFLTENDTGSVTIIASDSAGNAIPLKNIRIRIADSAVASLVDSLHVVARKPGQTEIKVEYGSRSDTKTIYVSSRSARLAADSARRSTGASSANFKMPAVMDHFPDSLKRQSNDRDSVVKNIHTDPNIANREKNLEFSGAFLASIAENYSHPDSSVGEDRTGPLLGGVGTLVLYRKLELSGTVRRGTLQSTTTVGEPLTVLDGEASVGVFPIPQFGVRGGYVLRTEQETSSAAQWKYPKVSAVTRFSFIGDVVNTYTVFSLMPKATYSDTSVTPSLLSLGGEAGIEVKVGAVNLGVTYNVEQFKFDNSARIENFSSIRLRLGLQRGW